MTESAARKQAKREASFYRHLTSFVLVNAFLIALNVFASPGHFWAIYPLLGWGIGLANDAFRTFGSGGREEWLERRARELMGPEFSESRLRALVDESLDERVPAGAPQDVSRLQRRIEHLEAIVTSHDWDAVRANVDAPLAPPPVPAAPPEARPPLADALDEAPPAETSESRTARLARRLQ
jgi:hypothetical protein